MVAWFVHLAFFLYFSCFFSSAFCLTTFSSLFQFLVLLSPLLKEQLSTIVIVWLCESIRLFYGPVNFRAVLMEASYGGQLQIVVAEVVVRILTYAGKLLFFSQVRPPIVLIQMPSGLQHHPETVCSAVHL